MAPAKACAKFTKLRRHDRRYRDEVLRCTDRMPQSVPDTETPSLRDAEEALFQMALTDRDQFKTFFRQIRTQAALT